MPGSIRLPGSSGDYASAPDTAAYNLNDTFFLAAFAALDDWTPGAVCSLIGQFTAAGNQRAYLLRIGGSGNIQMQASDNGTTNETASSGIPGFANGTAHWVGASFNAGTIQGYDGGTDIDLPVWVAAGGTGSFGSVVACHNSTGLLEIGSINAGTSQICVGNVYRAAMYSDVAATIAVFDADFTKISNADVAAGTFIESQGATVTFNGNVSVVGDPSRFLVSGV